MRALALLILVSLATPALAQSVAPTPTREKLDRKLTEEERLRAVQQQLGEARARREALAAEIKTLGRDEGSINRALVEATRRAQELESQASRIEAQLVALDRTRSVLTTRLRRDRAGLSRVLGALQRMGGTPPPALLVHPDDALKSIRSAILMGSVVPPMRARTAALTGQLKTLARTTQQIAEQKTQLSTALASLSQDEQRLTALLERKQELSGVGATQLATERARATDLANQAQNLTALIGKLESEIDSAAKAADSARAADAARSEREAQRLAQARAKLKQGLDVASLRPRVIDPNDKLPVLTADPARTSPAIAFSDAAGQVLRPVAGRQVASFGDKLPTGGTGRNIAFTTRPNARVRAPADGWVVYAGPFRSYGQLLILNAGETYHLILTGLAETSVRTGQFVLAGEPVGRMGRRAMAGAASRITGAAALASQDPVVTVELRLDGTPIDPAPWLVKEQTAQAAGTGPKGQSRDEDT